MSCDLCQKFGVKCEDMPSFLFSVKQRAVFVRGKHVFTSPPIKTCEAVIDNNKIEKVAKQIVYEAGSIPEMYFEDYDPGL